MQHRIYRLSKRSLEEEDVNVTMFLLAALPSANRRSLSCKGRSSDAILLFWWKFTRATGIKLAPVGTHSGPPCISSYCRFCPGLSILADGEVNDWCGKLILFGDSWKFDCGRKPERTSISLHNIEGGKMFQFHLPVLTKQNFRHGQPQSPRFFDHVGQWGQLV